MKLEVQLSDRTYQFLAEQARARGLDSPAEYLAALATEAEADRDAIEDDLIQGLQSGVPREMSRGGLGIAKAARVGARRGGAWTLSAKLVIRPQVY